MKKVVKQAEVKQEADKQFKLPETVRNEIVSRVARAKEAQMFIKQQESEIALLLAGFQAGLGFDVDNYAVSLSDDFTTLNYKPKENV